MSVWRKRFGNFDAAEKKKDLVEEDPPQPPSRYLYLLFLMSGSKEREAVIGDVIDRYPNHVKAYGRGNADRIILWDIGVSIWPFL
jgi:hypothetical protein